MNSPQEATARKAESQVAVLKLLGTFAGAAIETWLGWPPARRVAARTPAATAADIKGHRFGRAMKVLATLLLLTLVTALGAYLFMERLLASSDGPTRALIQAGTTGLTALALITAVKDIVLVFQKLVDYVLNNTAGEIIAEYVKYAATSLALFASIFAYTLSAQATPSPVPSELSRPMLLTPGIIRAEYFPYLFDLADGPPEWKRGVQLTRQQLADIEKLANTLKACVGELPNQDVVVEVVGFADANDFAVGGESSVEFNRQAANRRAAAVATALRASIGPTTVPSAVHIARVVEWPRDDPSAMTRSPRYINARPLAETAGRDQGRFNRRAEIAMLRAGVCEKYEAH